MNILNKKFVSLFLVIAIVFSLSACQIKPEKFTEYSFDYFDTVTTITGYEKTKKDFDNRVKKIKELLAEYHDLYTIYGNTTKEENLYSLNNQREEKSNIKLNEKIIDLLLFSKEMYTLTNGKTNIAMGSVLSVWHNYRTNALNNPENAEIPKKSLLLSAAEHTDISKVIVDKENSTVSITDSEILLDVGAVAKGYVVERIAEALKADGVSGYVINVGGNVKAVGEKPDGKWTVGIENPDAKEDGDGYLKYLQISDESVVTSGSYQRFYTVDGKDYHHIIDPDTLMPSEYFRLVSVVAKDSGLADALSTALFTMDYDEGLKLVENLSDVEVLWLFNDGIIKTTKGFDKYTKQ